MSGMVFFQTLFPSSSFFAFLKTCAASTNFFFKFSKSESTCKSSSSSLMVVSWAISSLPQVVSVAFLQAFFKSDKVLVIKVSVFLALFFFPFHPLG